LEAAGYAKVWKSLSTEIDEESGRPHCVV